MSSLASAAARGGASTIVFQIARMIIGFGTMIIIARILSPADFGLVAMVVAVVGFAEILRDFGLLHAAAQAPSLSKGQQSNLFWLNTFVGLIIGVILVVASPLLSSFYGEPRLQHLAQALAIVFFINGLSVQFKAQFVRELRIMPLNVSETLAQLVGSIVVVVCALLGTGYWALFFQQLANSLVALVLLVLFGTWCPGRPQREPMGDLVKYGASLAAQQTLNYFVRNVDTVLIGRVFGAATLGFYDRAYQLLMVPIGQLNAPLTRVAVPTLARLWNEGGTFEGYLNTAQKVGAFVTVPLYALIIGLGEAGVRVVFGDQWALSGVILQVLAVGGIFRSLMQISYWAYLSSGKVSAMLRFDLIALPLLALIIASGLPFGVIGIAAGHSVGYALYWLAGLLWMTRKLELRLAPLLWTAARSVLIQSVPVALVGLLVSKLVASPLLALIGGFLASVLTVAILALLIKPLRADYAVVLRVARLAVRKETQ